MTHRVRVFSLLALFITTLALVTSWLPTKDADLFWQMAYGREFLRSGTLYIEHGMFGWAELARVDTIYCAWLPQLAFYLIYQRLGLGCLLGLRTAVLLVALGAILWTLWRAGPGHWASGALLGVVWVLWSFDQIILRPNLFSFLFFNLLVFLWFGLVRGDGRRFPWLAGLLMLLWVNCHAGFIYGLIFLGVASLAEGIDHCRLGKSQLSPLLQALAGSLLVINLNPYGPSYPFQLLREIIDRALGGLGMLPQNRSMGWYLGSDRIVEFQGVFSEASQANHFHEYFMVVLCFILVLAWQFRLEASPVRWAPLTVLLAFVLLCLTYSRVASLAPTVLFYCHVLLPAPVTRSWKRVGVLLGLLAMLFAGRGLYEWRYYPSGSYYPGYGVNLDMIPVSETDFVQQFVGQGRLYNSYQAGAYLLWKLTPDFRVMVDPRGFPYASILDELFGFLDGQNFDEFVGKHPAEAAVIALEDQECLKNFMRSPAWRPAYFGLAAVVFVPSLRKLPVEAETFGPDLPGLVRSQKAAYFAAQFALVSGKPELATRLLRAGQGCPGRLSEEMGLFNDFLEAEELRRSGSTDFARMIELHERCVRGQGPFEDRNLLGRLYLARAEQLQAAGDAAGARRFREAAAQILTP